MKHLAILGLMAALFVGCGKKDDNLANRAGESLGKQLTDFTKAVGKGIDQKMSVEVSLRPEVLALGLTNSIAKSLGLDPRVGVGPGEKKGIAVYFIASQSVSNTLVARALNADGAEIGRCKKPIVLQKDDAAYVTFEFDGEMDTAMVRKYAIGL
jgi:hypothetical protein